MFHFAGAGGEPLGGLHSALEVGCRLLDWACRVVARRMRHARLRVRLPLEEDGRPSDDAHISESRYGAPGFVAVPEDRRVSDDADISGLRYGAPERARFRMRFRMKMDCARFGMVFGGSMLIIGDVARRENPG